MTEENRFPKGLRDPEKALIEARRKQSVNGTYTETTGDQNLIGVALSGGGIRSATFALGVFQALAKKDKIRRIDYLSTVSGGGYFGSFLGRWYCRIAPKTHAPQNTVETPAQDIAQKTTEHVVPKTAQDMVQAGLLPNPARPPRELSWLRENGRYLAPNGSGDLLTWVAALLRNWAAVQIVLYLFWLLPFVLLNLIRETAIAHGSSPEDAKSIPMGDHLWLSPYLLVPVVWALLAVFPLGTIYWWSRWGRIVLAAVSAALAIFLFLRPAPLNLDDASPWIWVRVGSILWLAGITLFAIILGVWSWRREEAFFRNRVSDWLGWFLLIAAVSAALAVFDSLGGTFAGWGRHKSFLFIAGVPAVLAAIASYGQKILSLLGISAGSQTRPGNLLSIVAYVVAGILVCGLATALSITAHAVGRPDGPPQGAANGNTCAHLACGWLLPYGGEPEDVNCRVCIIDARSIVGLIPGVTAAGKSSGTPTAADGGPDSGATKNSDKGGQDWPATSRLSLALAILVVLTLVFGRSRTFVNRSTYSGMYQARLERAYLGASNPMRREKTNPRPDVTDAVEGDGIAFASYAPHASGGPLHILNVTLNETIEGTSNIERRDRKGMGMAVGPCGVSVGANHHAVWVEPPPPTGKAFDLRQLVTRAITLSAAPVRWLERVPPDEKRRDGSEAAARAQQAPPDVADQAAPIEPAPAGGAGQAAPTQPPAAKGTEQVPPAQTPDDKDAAPAAPLDFEVFPPSKAGFACEDLGLSDWVAISGAAVSTGMGARTNLGLSLLTGFANIRLGRWWNSGISPWQRPQTTSSSFTRGFGLVAAGLLPVQSALQEEFSARFHGPHRKLWYLSDGGHFENMGAYELIRRRVSTIIVCDGEEDQDYTFLGLSNLIRKARLDFRTEIDFWSPKDETSGKLPSEIEVLIKQGGMASPEAHFCKLDDLRARKKEGQVQGFSLGHFSVATIHYPDGSQGVLIYLKPTLTDDVPPDVLEYARAHPTFPQETTAEQFFNEAQWESYRRLGQYIGEKLLG